MTAIGTLLICFGVAVILAVFGWIFEQPDKHPEIHDLNPRRRTGR